MKTPKTPNLLQVEAKRREEALKRYAKTGHTRPTTRREFLGSGLIAGISTLALPSLLTVIAREAEASEMSAECQASMQPSGNWIPYIQVAFGGGAAMQAACLQLDSGRQLLSSYSTTGLGSVSNFQVTHEFGNVPLAQKGGAYISQIMQGLTTAAGATALKNTAMVKYAVPSVDDRDNPDGILGLVMNAGRRGSDLPALGTPRTMKLAAFQRATAIQGIQSVDAFINALVPQGAISTYIKDSSKRTQLLRLINNLSANQRKVASSSSSTQTLAKLVECASGKNIDMTQVDTSQYDARKNAAVSGVWGINSSSASTLRETLHATVVMNALTGKAAGGRIDLTGYDYHGSARTTTNSLDLDGGQIVGRVLKTAQVLGSPVFVHMTTDGSVETNSTGSDSNYGSDAGARGTGAFFIYNPQGRPATTDTQIGQFNAGQAADTTWINTWTVDRCALAVFANYLQYHKQASLLNTMVPGQFDSATLAKVLKVA